MSRWNRKHRTQGPRAWSNLHELWQMLDQHEREHKIAAGFAADLRERKTTKTPRQRRAKLAFKHGV